MAAIAGPSLGRLLGQAFDAPRSRSMLDGFVDSLVQSFENCRPGLSDEEAASGGPLVESYFVRTYEQERPRLEDAVRRHAAHLPPGQREPYLARVDDLVRRVVIPAYSRLSAPFTVRERNDFYQSEPRLHGLERLGFAAAGMALGAFVVAAPFIPIWSKEWVAVFMVGGLVFPDLRRVFVLRRYQKQVNALVARIDDEIWRMDLDLITRDPVDDGDAEPADVTH